MVVAYSPSPDLFFASNELSSSQPTGSSAALVEPKKNHCFHHSSTFYPVSPLMSNLMKEDAPRISAPLSRKVRIASVPASSANFSFERSNTKRPSIGSHASKAAQLQDLSADRQRAKQRQIPRIQCRFGFPFLLTGQQITCHTDTGTFEGHQLVDKRQDSVGKPR